MHKPVIRKLEKRKVYSSVIDNIWDADLADAINKQIVQGNYFFVMCYWYFQKDKKGITNTNDFRKILDESNRKANKIWLDKGSEFYNRSMKSWLEKSSIEIYSKYDEGKSVVAERFVRTWKNKIYKYITSISKNVSIDQLDDIVDK